MPKWLTSRKIGNLEFIDTDKSFVLDKATRHEIGDNARGWSVVENGKSRGVTEDEFASIVSSYESEYIWWCMIDGFHVVIL